MPSVWHCWPVVRKVAAIRRYRRTRRIVKGAGAAAVKKTAARKVVTWVCVATAIGGTGGGMWTALPPYTGGASAPARVAPAALAPAAGFGTLGSYAEVGDAVIVYLPPGWLEQAESIGTIPPVAFAPVPDFPFPTPTVPQPIEIGPATPETPPQPTPVPEPNSGALLTGAVVAMLVLGRIFA